MRYEIVDLEKIPFHMRGDYHLRNQNVAEERILCSRCDGTGNELLSMSRTCQACGGDGISKGNELNFKD